MSVISRAECAKHPGKKKVLFPLISDCIVTPVWFLSLHSNQIKYRTITNSVRAKKKETLLFCNDIILWKSPYHYRHGSSVSSLWTLIMHQVHNTLCHNALLTHIFLSCMNLIHYFPTFSLNIPFFPLMLDPYSCLE